ncbi:MAG: biotin/lipoyl-binding protein, partial [Lachnospiraceae bacterium]|nr:biotin/lipoyl-binding protein [Lachnospiraceae bacterium]
MKLKFKKEAVLDKIKWVKTRKKKTKILIACGLVVVLVAGGVFGFNVYRRNNISAQTTPIMSAQVEKGDLSTTIEGTGTLTNADATDIQIPTGINVKKVKVSVGDEVKKGDVLATVDTTSLSAELLATQDELDDVNSELSAEADNDTTQYVSSTVDGRVKKIYAKKNTDVADTILDKGALILISMDGKMAVDLETSVSVTVGQEVTVTLSDGDTVTGTVVKAGDDSCTVTMTDNGTGYKEEVTVTTASGKTVGSGKLYINKEAKVTATEGTVKKILVSENESVSEGDSLLKLKGDFVSSDYLALETEKENLEEKLELLLKISQNKGITAEEDGIVTAVNVSDSTEATSDSSSSSSSDSTQSSVLTQTSAINQDSSGTETAVTLNTTNSVSGGMVALSSTSSSNSSTDAVQVSSSSTDTAQAASADTADTTEAS